MILGRFLPVGAQHLGRLLDEAHPALADLEQLVEGDGLLPDLDPLLGDDQSSEAGECPNVADASTNGVAAGNPGHFGVEANAAMPSLGWDWTELQEAALRFHRTRELSTEDRQKNYEDEINNLQDRVHDLEAELATLSDAAISRGASREDLGEALGRGIGPEIYGGEFLDRLRYAARSLVEKAEHFGIDTRSLWVLQRLAEQLPETPELKQLREDLRSATKDPRRLVVELCSLLTHYGYEKKAEKKHVRMEPSEGYGGLESITIPKTPSDHRSSENLRKQIERTLGIIKL